jgi:hypothetical protein
MEIDGTQTTDGFRDNSLTYSCGERIQTVKRSATEG